MAESELIKALRQRGEERIKNLWEEAQNEAGRLSDEMNGRLNKVRSDIHRHLGRQSEQRKDIALLDARTEAQRLQLENERQLVERCLRLAKEELSALAERERRALLRKLAEETPNADWRSVRVSPEDTDVAKECFTNVEIVPDSTIGAGFVVANEDERIVVDNTLETRLYRAWPQLLPELLNAIRCAAEEDESAEID